MLQLMWCLKMVYDLQQHSEQWQQLIEVSSLVAHIMLSNTRKAQYYVKLFTKINEINITKPKASVTKAY